MLVIIYGKNPSRTVRAVERTRQDVPYLAVILESNRKDINIQEIWFAANTHDLYHIIYN